VVSTSASCCELIESAIERRLQEAVRSNTAKREFFFKLPPPVDERPKRGIVAAPADDIPSHP